MVFDLLSQAAQAVGKLSERLNYEIDRARKVVPTLIRFGISEAEDLVHRFQHWRGSCDHTHTQAKPRKRATTKGVRRVKTKPARKAK